MVSRGIGSSDAAFWFAMEEASKQMKEMAADASVATGALEDAEAAALEEKSRRVYTAHRKQHQSNFTQARLQMAAAVMSMVSGASGSGGEGGGGGGGEAGGSQAQAPAPAQRASPSPAGGTEANPSDPLVSFLQDNLGLIGQLWRMTTQGFQRGRSVQGLITSMAQRAVGTVADVQRQLSEQDSENAAQLDRIAKTAGNALRRAQQRRQQALRDQHALEEQIVRAKTPFA